MKLLLVILLSAFVASAIGARRRRDNSYGDELVTPAPAGDVHEEATEAVEGSAAPVESSGSEAKESGGGDNKSAGYSESSGNAPKESEPVAVEQATQKSTNQQPSGYRK